MTLATHIVIAGAITRPIAGAHPALLFLVSLASHYLADAIPHWDYDIRSVPDEHKQNPDAIRWNFSERVSDSVFYSFFYGPNHGPHSSKSFSYPRGRSCLIFCRASIFREKRNF
ncbi:MAG: hypothetical protein UY61_C0012G0009 [Candidatus Adlerbacteria bacterium GW2011_GWC1_50_9]|uniref:Uncharacterized protein n=1 Tax=Candidatus Adlerbacteria bacterium GW2011_GWC1_50_9 TaxID=1618608 RepID=A0A0G1WQY7_9BACT|nr:MAG: hypothetical protein UY61_C0012G0009 [Candidatus Adlerbacteria bacterium GW2011_GWC1_50_9]